MVNVLVRNREGEFLSGILTKNKKTNEVVIICHGSRGDKNGILQKNLSKNLKKYFNTFRFDFSGNGDSQGKLEDSTYSKEIDDLLFVIMYLQNKKYRVRAVIGHSKSATEVLLASRKLLHSGVEIIIALAPRIFLKNSQEYKMYKKKKNEVLEKGYYIYPGSYKHKVTKAYLDDLRSHDNLFDEFNSSIRTVIIHGTRDEIINISESRTFAKKFRKVLFFEVEDAVHGFNNHTSELLEKLKIILK